MFCPQCGAQNAEGSKFCISCGKEFPVIQPANPDSNSAKESPPPVIQQQTTYQQPAPVNPQPAPQQPGATQMPGPALWGAILIFIGFFLKWFGINPYAISAFDFVTKAKRALGYDEGYIDKSTSNIITIFTVLLIVMLAASVIALLYGLNQRIDAGLFTICKVIPIIILTGLLIYGFSKFSEATRYEDFEGERRPSLFDMLQIGFYLSFAGSVVLLFQKRRT